MGVPGGNATEVHKSWLPPAHWERFICVAAVRKSLLELQIAPIPFPSKSHCANDSPKQDEQLMLGGPQSFGKLFLVEPTFFREILWGLRANFLAPAPFTPSFPTVHNLDQAWPIPGILLSILVEVSQNSVDVGPTLVDVGPKWAMFVLKLATVGGSFPVSEWRPPKLSDCMPNFAQLICRRKAAATPTSPLFAKYSENATNMLHRCAAVVAKNTATHAHQIAPRLAPRGIKLGTVPEQCWRTAHRGIFGRAPVAKQLNEFGPHLGQFGPKPSQHWQHLASIRFIRTRLGQYLAQAR